MVEAKLSAIKRWGTTAWAPALAATMLFVFTPAAEAARSSRRHGSSGAAGATVWILTMVVLVGVTAGIFGLVFYFDRRRSQKIAAMAQSLGLTFRRKPTEADKALPAGSYLANEGHGRVVSNVLEATRSDELDFTLFDYQYTVGYGKTSATYQQTVTRMQSALFRLPKFILYPETIFAKMGKVFGKSDINFPDSPDFSDKFILRGDDETSTRALFTPALRQALEAHGGLTIEAAGDLLFIFRPGRRFKPDELPAKMEQDKRIAALFFEAQRAGGSTPPPLPQAG